MIDGIIHALASYHRVESLKETQPTFVQSTSFKELEMTLSPELQARLSQRMSDGRPIIEHIIDAKAAFKDLNNIGRT